MSYLIIDVSDYQAGIDWKRVKRDGISAAWIKATEGINFNAKLYRQHRANAQAVGLRTGAYHFARPDSNPYGAADEARHFAAIIGKPGRRDLKPVLDFETWSKALTAEQHVSWARAFNRVIKEKLGCYPVFYSYSDFIRRMAPSSPIGSALWLANYGPNDGKDHPVAAPAPWKKVQAHQFTSKYSIGGASVDMSEALSLTPLLAHPVLGWL